MTRYIIHFISTETEILTQEEFDLFNGAYAEVFNPDIDLRGFTSSTRVFYFSKQNIAYIVSETVTDAQSKIVTPLTPDELRGEAERKKQHTDVSLDAQLKGEIDE